MDTEDQDLTAKLALFDDVLEHAPESDAPGTMLGDYRLIEQLGEGGFGVVFHAEQEEPVKRSVALKLIKPGMDSSEVIRRFEAERQALAIMDHPNIAKVFAAGTTDSGRPYFVMELVRGKSLTKFCDTRSLSIRQRVEIFRIICSAIQHAHQKGIIHRDLKPSNILVDDEDGKGAPRVIDFGIAKALTSSLTSDTLMTAQGQIMGTLQYMSPEQLEFDSSAVDTRSDIYSLGVILYELLCGRPPVEVKRLQSASLAELVRIVQDEDPLSPSKRVEGPEEELQRLAEKRSMTPARIRPSIAGDLDAIVLKAMEKNPARRYASVNELSEDLGRYLRNDVVLASPPSALYRMRKFSRRHRTGLLAAAVVSLALVAATVISIWKAAVASAAQAEEQRQREIATSVGEFLTEDLLLQGHPDVSRDPDVKLRIALDRAAGRVGARFKDAPEAEAAVRFSLGATYAGLGIYDQAEAHLARSLRLRTGILGAEHETTLETRLLWAEVLSRRARFFEALKEFNSVGKLARDSLGANHFFTLRARMGLADVQRNLGELAESEKAMREVIALLPRAKGTTREDRITAESNLADLLAELGQFDEAEALLASDIELSPTRQFARQRKRAALRRRRGDFQGAMDLIEQSLQECTSVLGGEHPQTQALAAHKAVLLSETGHVPEALEMASGLLDQSMQTFGAKHPSTLLLINNLATMLLRAGRLEEAETRFRDVLENYRDTLGNAHPDTLSVLNNLGYLYQVQGKNAEAATVLAESIKGLTKTYGASSPQTLQSRSNRGLAIYGLGRPDEAGKILRAVMEDSRDSLGAGHRASLIAKMSYAKFLAETEKTEEAIVLGEEVIDAGMETFGAVDAKTTEYVGELERMFREAGENEKALALRRSHYDKIVESADIGHPSVLPALISLANALFNSGQEGEAQALLSKALQETSAQPKSENAVAAGRKIIELLAALEESSGDGLRLATRLQRSFFESDWPDEKTLRLVSAGSTWKYWDSAGSPGENWFSPDHDDSNWNAGPAPLGYGEGGLATTLDFGPDPDAKPMCAFFRLQFESTDPVKFSRLRLWIRRDDGMAVYLNGKEIARDLLAPDARPDAPATAAVAGINEAIPWLHLIEENNLRTGTNVLAIEMHQVTPNSSDLGFELMLEALVR